VHKLKQASQNTEMSDTLTNYSLKKVQRNNNTREKGNQALISTTTVEYTCNNPNKP